MLVEVERGNEMNFFGVIFVIVCLAMVLLVLKFLYEVFKKLQIKNRLVIFWRKVRILLPKFNWVNRLCLVLGMTLVILSMVKIRNTTIVLNRLCPNRYGCFGDLNVLETILLFISPFIIAKVIEFIVIGFGYNSKQK